MHRLPVSREMLNDDVPPLSQDMRTHIKAVRLKDGEEVELFDGLGHARLYKYSAKDKALLSVGNLREEKRNGVDIVLFACITKGARWDWTIEKATELGVAKIVPVISQRTIVRLSGEERIAKRSRWRKLAEEAARQCGSMWIPDILPAVDFNNALELMHGLNCFAGIISNRVVRSLAEAAKECKASCQDRGFGVVIGPEGDFTDEEKVLLSEKANSVSFGSSILRAETAAIYAISVLKAILEAK